MVGGATTVMDALEVLPVPPSVEVTWTLLFFTPAVVPCTLTETVQLALAANVPPERLMLPDPATAVAVPPQVLFKALGVATTRPAGRLSVKAIPVSARVVLGFWMVNVSDVVPFRRNAGRAKGLGDGGRRSHGQIGCGCVAGPAVGGSYVSGGVGVLPGNCAGHCHAELALAVNRDGRAGQRNSSRSRGRQRSTANRGRALATVSPVGSVSVNATPVSGIMFAAGLVMVKVSEVVAFSAIVEGLNAFAIDGGASTDCWPWPSRPCRLRLKSHCRSYSSAVQRQFQSR